MQSDSGAQHYEYDDMPSLAGVIVCSPIPGSASEHVFACLNTDPSPIVFSGYNLRSRSHHTNFYQASMDNTPS